MLTERQIGQYLKRIHYDGNSTADLSTLKRLQRRHLFHIPYENLDLLNQVPLSLEYEDLFRKIILNRRGGYCFELQGIYGYLLKSLGFSVTQYAGRFMDEPGTIQMRRHRLLVVDLDDGRYVCDVGVRSESPREPLKLAEDIVQTDGISEYRYIKDPFYGWVLMQKEAGKDWKPLLGFTEEIQIDVDYIMPSFFCERHPDSTFNKFMKISIFTEDSNLCIVGNTFKVYQGARVVERRELRTEAEAKTMLKEHFGIELPERYRVLSQRAFPDVGPPFQSSRQKKSLSS